MNKKYQGKTSQKKRVMGRAPIMKKREHIEHERNSDPGPSNAENLLLQPAQSAELPDDNGT